MTNSDEYNGWTNRETWALNLWLSNDQGLYEMTQERVRDAMASHIRTDDPDKWTVLLRQRAAGEAVKELWDELTDLDEGLLPADEILRMVKDVWADYRVDWDEIGRHWLEDLDES